MSILVLAEHHDGALACATAHVVSAAKQIVKESGGDIDVLVAGEGVAAIAEAAARLDGVSRVRVADHAAYAHLLAELVGLSLGCTRRRFVSDPRRQCHNHVGGSKWPYPVGRGSDSHTVSSRLT